MTISDESGIDWELEMRAREERDRGTGVWTEIKFGSIGTEERAFIRASWVFFRFKTINKGKPTCRLYRRITHIIDIQSN